MGNKGSKTQHQFADPLPHKDGLCNKDGLDPQLAQTVLQNISPDLFPLIAQYYRARRARGSSQPLLLILFTYGPTQYSVFS